MAPVVVGINTKASSIQNCRHVIVSTGMFPQTMGDLNNGFRVGHWPFIKDNVHAEFIFERALNWKISQYNPFKS
jgi:hypothetical protein